MIRILLVDDQELVRSGFRVILNTEPDFEVVAEATNGQEAVALAAELGAGLGVDVICMDVEMPLMNGIEASRQILGADHPAKSPAILILTTFGHEAYLFDALAAGVSGFLLKTSRAEQLIDAVRTLASGQALLGPDVTRAVIDRISADRNTGETAISSARPAASAIETTSASTAGSAGVVGDTDFGPARSARSALDEAGLTEREQDVIRLLALGQSNAEIASSLFLGEATVKTHISNILQKLGVRDRIQAAVWAHTNHVLDA